MMFCTSAINLCFACSNHDPNPFVSFRFKSTNVQRALAEAVALRKPVYAFPVQNLDTLQSIDKYKGEAVAVLRDAVCLKPVTTCEELYTAMLHYPIELCAGDFIRAEVRTHIRKPQSLCVESLTVCRH